MNKKKITEEVIDTPYVTREVKIWSSVHLEWAVREEIITDRALESALRQGLALGRYFRLRRSKCGLTNGT